MVFNEGKQFTVTIRADSHGEGYGSPAVRLQIVKGELDDKTIGVDYFGIIFSNTPVSMKVQEISRAILSIEGVENVSFENVEFDRKNQTFKFYFTIDSVYGALEYEKTFENPA